MNSKVIRPRHQFLSSLLICLGFSTTLVACGGDSSNSKSSPTASASTVETSMASPSAAAPVSPSASAEPIDTPSTNPIVSPNSSQGNTGTTGNNSGITGDNSGTSTPPRKRKKVKQRPAKQSENNGVVEKEGKASANSTRTRKSDPEQEPGALDSTPADSEKPKKNSQTKKQSGNTQKPKKQRLEKEDESDAPTTSPRSPGNSDQGSNGESAPGTKPKQGSDGQ